MSVSLVSVCLTGELGKMLDVLMWFLWVLMGGYSLWFLTRAKKSQALTLDELVMLWRIHKQQARCKAPLSKLEPILNPRSSDFSGFRCACGFRYVSKRLIIQNHGLRSDLSNVILARKRERQPFLKA
jgi:hypothetical protein